ncbi:BREX-2 system adenine-specific DNA-methyltransferase PglX [Nocardiopsis sp. NPDC058631]|uniref:BREX-2 system adenine-specific DNA-methyltransferase PglX n=1 Tax=Nocardiopsis sp. NPDC058631 TaxID=3346566 RepID=UPI003669E045
MVDHAHLLKDLQKQVRLLETDLRERSEDPTAIKGIGPNGAPETFDAFLKREYQRARDAERIATTEGAWREGQVTQAAVAWVLATVFVRFCEDNGLLEQPFIAGPKDDQDRFSVAQELKDEWVLRGRSENPNAPERTDRDWLEHAFEQMSVSSVMAGLFDKKHNPMWTITPSHQAAKILIDFWRSVGDDGHLLHNFTDPEWDTRFLGDLYQDLSEATRKTYALLQTPDFVEEFILDYTLEPAIAEFGLDGKRIYQTEDKGFRLIDPTCGSGHFLLGAFHRLLNKWREAEPRASDWDLINRSLKSVHGVDKNPFAVAIARFRLLIAAMKEGGVTKIRSNNPEWTIIVATGDSLIHGRDVPGARDQLFAASEAHHYATEDFYEHARHQDLLSAQSYHVVVGNPPYITVKDKQEREGYRERYSSCSGSYALSVPFVERFFNLAKRAGGNDPGSGFIGQITANSFMKREFGKKLIEEFLRNKVRLTHVVDSSGAYIPGHGTPTVILVGRNEPNSHRSKIRAIRGIRNEPKRPAVASEGLVWSAIASQISTPGSESDWVSVGDLNWEVFKSHPWRLSGGGAGELVEKIKASSSGVLNSHVYRVGFFGDTHSDEAFSIPASGFLGSFGERKLFARPAPRGDEVRDWASTASEALIFPYDENHELLPSSMLGKEFLSRFWMLRSELWGRGTFGGGTYLSSGREWWEWHQLPKDKGTHDWSIAFSFVTTHNHFSLSRENGVFNRSAPVIKLPEGVSVEHCLELLGVLNSSIACFWLKQVSHNKGRPGAEQAGADEPWEHRFEFTSTKVQDFPMSKVFALGCSREIDKLARQVASLEPLAVARSATPTAGRLKFARAESLAMREQMVALQEELDWEYYCHYHLLNDAQYHELCVLDNELPRIKPGERAFAIAMARRVAVGDFSTTWFSHHNHQFTPVTEIPAHWPEAYKQVVAKRIELIESDKNIGLIERPEYKRRWQSEPWEKKQQAALKSWLLDKCEDRRLWFTADDYGDERARPLSVRALANRVRDLFPEVVEVAALYDSSKDFAQVIADIVKTEHVPYLAALRYKDTGMRKRADWEHVWDLQREEDALNADLAEGEAEKRLDIPVPPKYTSADFRKNEYWSNRGKLDVPKERFISYLGAENDSDPSLLLGWAGWDHAQQADALATLAHERLEQDGWAEQRDRMVPLLAGLTELLPWVKQWHSEKDEYGDTPADHAEEDLTTLRNTTGITESEMKAWRPAARGKKA